MSLRKDQSLDELARRGNVAQFVSFAPAKSGLMQQYSRVAGFPANHVFSSARDAVAELLSASPERTVNVRSYAPDSPRSKEFVYGIADLETAMAVVQRLADEGLYVIANETVDIADGGVSGVVQGDVIEFAPDDTPRCVEKPGTASLPRELGIKILEKVYGFKLDIPDTSHGRVEFSIHPQPRGWKTTHTLTWEYEELSGDVAPLMPSMHWPNRFSKHLGDKVFGLLVADCIGASVPRTMVIGRRVAPFVFGKQTHSSEVWTRTAPVEPEPGLYTTVKGWTDPFRLLAREDTGDSSIVSVLSQSAVPAHYSGAALVLADNRLLIEGKAGEGDELMLGRVLPNELPESVTADVQSLYDQLRTVVGPVRFEWVHDGDRAWLVQLHKGQTETLLETIFPGEAERWIEFHADSGIDALRRTLSEMPTGVGLTVVGEIGLTSHLADLVRKSRRPARIVRQLEFAFV